MNTKRIFRMMFLSGCRKVRCQKVSLESSSINTRMNWALESQEMLEPYCLALYVMLMMHAYGQHILRSKEQFCCPLRSDTEPSRKHSVTSVISTAEKQWRMGRSICQSSSMEWTRRNQTFQSWERQ